MVYDELSNDQIISKINEVKKLHELVKNEIMVNLKHLDKLEREYESLNKVIKKRIS